MPVVSLSTVSLWIRPTDEKRLPLCTNRVFVDNLCASDDACMSLDYIDFYLQGDFGWCVATNLVRPDRKQIRLFSNH